MRTFESGATRNDDEDKLDYEGFLTPRVLRRYAEYMHSHRKQADDKLRASDNWQKGMPLKSYMSSMWRHFMAVWSWHRTGFGRMETALCALLFNVMGYLNTLLIQREKDRLEAELGDPVDEGVTLDPARSPVSPAPISVGFHDTDTCTKSPCGLCLMEYGRRGRERAKYPCGMCQDPRCKQCFPADGIIRVVNSLGDEQIAPASSTS